MFLLGLTIENKIGTNEVHAGAQHGKQNTTKDDFLDDGGFCWKATETPTKTGVRVQ